MKTTADIIRQDGMNKVTNAISDISTEKAIDRQVLGETVAMIQNLPGLRGAWLMSSRDQNGDVYDLSGQGRTLTNNGSTPFGVSGLQSYATFNGASMWLSRADEAGLDITGDLTVLSWFNPAFIGAGVGLVSKFGSVVGQRSFALSIAPSRVYFGISNTGALPLVQSVSSNTISASKWHFAAGKFTPSTRVSVFLNGTITENTTAIPASIFSGSADLNIGRLYAGAGLYFNGSESIVAICAASVSDAYLRAFYGVSRHLFGV